ncbi:hypothetical protein EJB05_05004 [Eragrostis curvula]|uniref:Uncharacterized protein n=1 Tax=Eragrostis curvula TaxID=38414 RepID=A0A5J9WC76_9POAL|nr:hypothetical protein EJB05_05004 [Eragrostis curvula]
MAANSPFVSFVSTSQTMAANSPFDCVLLDLDDTLYPGNTGLGPVLKRNIDEFLVAKLGITAEDAAAMRVELFRSHGSTLAGLIALGHDVHPDEYHSYVHGRLPYDRIAADPQLALVLQSIPQRKVLFTNSDRAHMKRALERLGVDEDIFDDVVCFETMNPHLFGEERVNGDVASERPVVILKPAEDAIMAGLLAAGTDPRRTIFLDDSERNIAAGKALGLRTALDKEKRLSQPYAYVSFVAVGKKVRSKDADYAMESIGSLRLVIPEIWGAIAGEQPELGIEKKGMRSELDSFLRPTTIQA